MTINNLPLIAYENFSHSFYGCRSLSGELKLQVNYLEEDKYLNCFSNCSIFENANLLLLGNYYVFLHFTN